MERGLAVLFILCIVIVPCGCTMVPWKEYVLDPGLRITQHDRQVVADIRTRKPHLGIPTALEKSQDESGILSLRVFFGDDFYRYSLENGAWVLTSEGYRILDFPLPATSE